MDNPIRKHSPCLVCDLDTLRHTGWFLVVENRWLDRLKILSWHPSLARQKNVQSVCCRRHLKTLLIHWLTEASLRLPTAQPLPQTIGSDPAFTDVDLGPQSPGRLVGELAVHREAFSRVWSGSPAALECILDALGTTGGENEPRALEFQCQIFDPPKSRHELSLQ